MSQIEVLIIVKELQPCKQEAIKKRAKEKFPNLKLQNYVSKRLTDLRRRGAVTVDNKGNWTVVDDSMLNQRNVREFDLVERLAAVEHQQWSDLMKYLLDNVEFFQSLEKVTNWVRLMRTPYSELSDKEKESDRLFARRVINALEAHMNLLGRASQ